MANMGIKIIAAICTAFLAVSPIAINGQLPDTKKTHLPGC